MSESITLWPFLADFHLLSDLLCSSLFDLGKGSTMVHSGCNHVVPTCGVLHLLTIRIESQAIAAIMDILPHLVSIIVFDTKQTILGPHHLVIIIMLNTG